MTKRKLESDNQDQEEAHFYFTIDEFSDLVDDYGIDAVIENISDELYIELFDYFVPPIDGEDEDD